MWQRIRQWLGWPRVLVVALVGLVVAGGTVGGAAWWVDSVADGRLHSATTVPERPVAIVLGTLVEPDGRPSDFLAARLEVARQLYAAGKVRAILVSGDDGQPEYNEVDPMRAWLIERGVPEHKVVGDYAGFDTYSTCVRAAKVFGVRSATVVTQNFHLPRAVALCQKVGIDTVGVGDDTVNTQNAAWSWGAVRDKVACVKAVAELVMGPDPKFLGRRETGVDDALRN